MFKPNVDELNEEIEAFCNDWREVIFKNLSSGKTKSSLLKGRVHKAFLTSVVADASPKKVLYLLDLVTDIFVFNFVSSINDSKSISLPMGDAEIQIIGEATTAYMDTNTWLIGFYAAVVNRNKSALDVLCSVQDEVFLGADIKPDEFDLAYVRACKGLFDSNANIGQLLVDAMEASDEKYINEAKLNYSWNVILPVLFLLPYAIEGDHDGDFTKRFQDAVESHINFWGAGDNQYSWDGWRSLPLMAAAVLLFDNQGLKMPENELVPRWIVEEFHTYASRNKNSNDDLVDRALTAIKASDNDTIQFLRQEIRPKHFDSLLKTWDVGLPWEIKNRYIELLMDQDDKSLEELMLDGLNSPCHETRAYSICALSTDKKLFDKLLTGGWIDANKVDEQIAIWKSGS